MFNDVKTAIESWDFLGESAVNWFIFIGLLIVSFAGWKMITDYID